MIQKVLPPKDIDCSTSYYPNKSSLTNQSSTKFNQTRLRLSNVNLVRIAFGGQLENDEPMYNYSKEYGRSVLTDVRILFSIKRIENENFL